jgi:hypothetical protein
VIPVYWTACPVCRVAWEVHDGTVCDRITELEEANRNFQTSLREMTRRHAQWRADLEAQVRDLQTTNHHRLCGCEESAGVLGCAVGCACRCHRLEAENARLRQALDAKRALGDE